jgi:hypothetical protein
MDHPSGVHRMHTPAQANLGGAYCTLARDQRVQVVPSVCIPILKHALQSGNASTRSTATPTRRNTPVPLVTSLSL